MLELLIEWAQTAVFPSVAVFTTWVVLWSRQLPDVALRIWFTVTLGMVALVLAVVAHTARILKNFGVISFPYYQHLLRQWVALVMHGHRRLNPHIRMVAGEGSLPWETIDEPHLLMANHTSFQDLFGGLWIVPLRYMSLMRIFFKGSLANTPILGTIFPDAGMFPVHYTSTQYDNFSVERSKQTVVMEAADAYVKSGGSLFLAPEGVVNRNPRELAEFRVGSFNMAVKHKLPLFYIVYCGHDEVWPAGWNIGGNAADVLFYIGKLDVDYSEGSPDLDGKALSLKLRAVMQQRLDHLYEERDRKFQTCSSSSSSSSKKAKSS